MRLVALTVDYEIFGNGTGDVRRHIIEPTERMARICERHDVPLTVFVEVEEYIAFDRYRNNLERCLGYDPARLIREQVIQLTRRGHDFQLHTHPKWFGARFESGRWLLHKDEPTVDDLFETQKETDSYIGARKAVLEEIIHSVAPSQKVQAYRAGALRAQPGARLLTALAANHISIDSSVVCGLRNEDGLRPFDYRRAPSDRRLWRVRNDVCREDADGFVWEIPIHSVMRRQLHKINRQSLKAKFSRNIPKARQRETVEQLRIPKNPLGIAQFLFQPAAIKLDFHNISATPLVKWIKAAPPPAPADPLDVLVLIGHSKEHQDDHSFERLLRLLSEDATLKVAGLTEIADKLSALLARYRAPSFAETV
jgi:hypothetical protein